jgi:hypothetical protein
MHSLRTHLASIARNVCFDRKSSLTSKSVSPNVQSTKQYLLKEFIMSKGSFMFKALAVGAGVVIGVIVVNAMWPHRGSIGVSAATAQPPGSESSGRGSGTTSASTSSGKIEQSLQNITNFGIGIPGDFQLIQGDREAIIVEGPGDLIDKIEIVQNGSSVEVKSRKQSWGYNNWGNSKLRGTVYFRSMEKLSLASSGKITAASVKSPQIVFAIAGSADLKVDELSCESVKFSVAGSGDVATQRLRSETVKISIAGSGDAKVWATNELNVSIAGSGDVRYVGDPKITKSVAGSGSVKSL